MRTLVTSADLVEDLRRLGVDDRPVMVHVSMSAIGWVVGGTPTIIEALLTATGGHAVLAVTGWEDRPPYHQADWSEAERAVYRESCPAFDPRTARAELELGRFAEAVRTWPEAKHSYHPTSGFAAVGLEADWLVSGQQLDEGYGADSPLARLVEANGSVLALGAPLQTLTLLHHAEYAVESPLWQWNEYEMPVRVDGQRVWRRIRELDSSLGAFPYEQLGLDTDEFEVIGREALEAGIGCSGTVGRAQSHLFPAPGLVDFATTWLAARFT